MMGIHALADGQLMLWFFSEDCLSDNAFDI
jgi:hypothetical protein